MISVVIPVYNSRQYLRSCLEHLAQSTLAPHEVIVVDDGSTDGSAAVAREFGARVIPTQGRTGPGMARNLGAQSATGDILFFIDSDVCVHPDTVERVQSCLDANPGVSAVIGSYDDTPGAKDFISTYRNLMHCYVHQRAREEACTFWSGCGAIRRDVFLQHSGFDASYGRPAIEDIELGYRLRRARLKILLDKQLQVKHLKRWTFWNLIKTDIFDRGIPWTELILRDRSMPNDLNLQLSQRVSVALMFLMLGAAAALAVYWQGYFLTPVFAVLFCLLGRYWLEVSDTKPRKALVWVSLCVAVLVTLALVHEMLGVIPLVVLGYGMLFLRHRWHRSGRSSIGRMQQTGWFMAFYILLAVVLILLYLPRSPLIISFLCVAIVLVILNTQFYVFLASKRGRLFALSAIPLHLLYHFYNGLSFAAGVIHYTWKAAFASRAAQLGVPRHPTT